MPVPTSAPTFDKPLNLPIAKQELDRINEYLRPLVPEDILRWATEHIPGLFQTTAFGLTGLVAIDMLSKITSSPPPLIFIDTLYHFPETYELVEEVKKRYNVPVAVYKPEGCETVGDFEMKYGEKLWERDEEMYDFAVKASPLLYRTYQHASYTVSIGGTSTTSIQRTWCESRYNGPSRISGRRSCKPATTRGRQHGSHKTQPAVRLELPPRRVVYFGKQSTTQQIARPGIPQRR